MLQARGVWAHQPRLSPGQWAFAQYHLYHDLLDEQALAKARLQEKMALHYLVRVDPALARKAILGEALPNEGSPLDSEEAAMVQAAGDPYFGGLTDLPLPPIFQQGGPLPVDPAEQAAGPWAMASEPLPVVRLPVMPVGEL